MKFLFLLTVFLVFAAGCVGNLQGKYDVYQNVQVNASFVQQFENLITEWNKISSMNVIRTDRGYVIYVDSSLNVTNLSCSNKMAPSFGCSDVLLEYYPAEKELKEGDVVSFEINSSEAQTFSEEPFAGTKIIQRRIYRIGNDTTRYYVMKRDSTDATHKFLVRYDRIRGRVVGFVFDANIEKNPAIAYTSMNKTIEDYNGLVDRWNYFVGKVYAGKIKTGSAQDDFNLYYDKGIEVPSLACTGSMKPTIDCNDLIFAYAPGSEDEIKVGDIISFRIAPNETSGFLEPSTTETIHIMHRVFRITQSQGKTAFITKGDNPDTNKQTDAIYLGMDRVETKVVAYFKDSFNLTFNK
jgi:signal peptidase I